MVNKQAAARAAQKNAKKQKNVKKQEKAQEKAMLSTPGTIRVSYRDLRKTGSNETKSLHEFLEWAKEEKVLVLTEAMYKYYTTGQMPRSDDDTKVWSPAIETSCMTPESLGEEIYAFRNSLFVDDMYRSTYSVCLKTIMEREQAYRHHRALMHAECVDVDANVPVAEMVESDTVATCDTDVVVTSDDVGPDALLPPAVDATVIPTPSVAMPPDLQGWKISVQQGKPSLGFDEILLKLLNSSTDMSTTVQLLNKKVDEGFAKVREEFAKVHKKVDKGFAKVHKELRDAHKAISDNGESIVRVSLSTFLKEFFGPDVESVTLPIIGRCFPFVNCNPLEALAKLCLKEKSSNKSRNVPAEVEVDVFVKMIESGDRKYLHSPPGHAFKDNPSTSSRFSCFIVGECTRSSGLCKASYMHPRQPESSTSSRLLYKFVQLERGLMAARAYYGVDEDCMAGGIIDSPSFKNISHADGLIKAVLVGREHAFQNIANLHGRKRMWLTSL